MKPKPIYITLAPGTWPMSQDDPQEIAYRLQKAGILLVMPATGTTTMATGVNQP